MEERDFRQLYKKQRPSILGFLHKHFQLSETDRQDITQETIITYWKKARNKDFKLKCKLTTLLIAICKRIASNYLRKTTPTQFIDCSTSSYSIKDLIFANDDIEVQIEKEEQKSILRYIVAQLDKKCNKLVKAVIYKSKSYKEIIVDTNVYKNEDSAKTAFYKCKQKILDFYHKNIEPWMNPKN